MPEFVLVRGQIVRDSGQGRGSRVRAGNDQHIGLRYQPFFRFVLRLVRQQPSKEILPRHRIFAGDPSADQIARVFEEQVEFLFDIGRQSEQKNGP